MRISNNTMLITGGGSGIGRELARRFHDQGNVVVVAGRRREPLEETVDGRANMHVMVGDMDNAEGVKLFAAALFDAYPDLNVVVANAGIMRREDISHARDLSDAEATITTNLLGPIRLIDATIDHLARQADAAIITVTSGLAYVPMPATATYCGTKAAIHLYTVSLRSRLDGVIEVIELVPPGVQTELTPGQSTRDQYMPLDEYGAEVMQLFARTPTPPEILVNRVRLLRDAEVEGRFQGVLDMLSRA